MRAIEFQLSATKTLEVRFGESEFKTIDDFWTDFKPDGGEKTTAFKPCICKDTPGNRSIVEGIRVLYEQLKKKTDECEVQILKMRNHLEK